MSTPTIIHVVPLQIQIVGEEAIITCADPRAKIDTVTGELVFRLKLPAAGEPLVNQCVCFTVDDPPDPTGYDDYLTVYSSPPLERLKPWIKTDATSTSPKLVPTCDLEVVVIAFREPRPNNSTLTAVQVQHGRRRIKLGYEGAGDNDLFNR